MKRGSKLLGLAALISLMWACQGGTPNTTPTPTPAAAEQSSKPSPGPIIVLGPKETSPGSGVYNTGWKVGDTVCDPADATQSGFMRLDGFGKATTLKVWKKDHTFVDVTTALSIGFTVVDGSGMNHAIEIRRTPKGNFQWKSNGVSLQICDMASSECLPNCVNACGLPLDFFGTIAGTPQFAGVDLSNVDYVELTADYTNPCQ